jgi:hypothetical protein
MAFFRHSCVPNTSAVVVGGYLLMHATADAEPGAEFTFNKLGRYELIRALLGMAAAASRAWWTDVHCSTVLLMSFRQYTATSALQQRNTFLVQKLAKIMSPPYLTAI